VIQFIQSVLSMSFRLLELLFAAGLGVLGGFWRLHYQRDPFDAPERFFGWSCASWRVGVLGLLSGWAGRCLRAPSRQVDIGFELPAG